MQTTQDDSLLIKDDENFASFFNFKDSFNDSYRHNFYFDTEKLASLEHLQLFLRFNFNTAETDIQLLDSEESIRYRQNTIFLCFLSLVALALSWLQWNYVRPNPNSLNNHFHISLALHKPSQPNITNTSSSTLTKDIIEELATKEKITPPPLTDNVPTQKSSPVKPDNKTISEKSHTATITDTQKIIDLQQSMQEVVHDHIREKEREEEYGKQSSPNKASLSQRLIPFDKSLAKALNAPETIRLNKPRFNNMITVTTMSLSDGLGNAEKNYFMIDNNCYYSSPLTQDSFSPSPIVEKVSCNLLFMKEKITRDSIIQNNKSSND